MEANESLPPSPPATHSSKGSPNAPQQTSPDFTPPKSPEDERTMHSASPPMRGSSPLPPLPAEVFLLILKHIDPPKRPALRLVSRSWAVFLVSEPQLWTSLRVALHGNSATERWTELWASRASVNSNGKSNGGIREILLELRALDRGPGQSYGDLVQPEVAIARMEKVFQCAHAASVTREVVEVNGRRVRAKPSTLDTLKVLCYPNTLTTLFVLNNLMGHARDHLFERIENIDLFINNPGVEFTDDVLMMWPTAVNLKLRFPERSKSARSITAGNGWTFRPPSQPGRGPAVNQSLPHLRHLQIAGVFISRSMDLPLMPNLTRLVLSTLVWEGKSLFRLLRYVSKTVQCIDLTDVRFEEEVSAEMEQEEWDLHVNIRDDDLADEQGFADDDSTLSDERIEDLAPIVFPHLHSLMLEGNGTPPLFSSLEYVENLQGEPTLFPTPVFVMPNLAVVSLSDIITEQDLVMDESFGALATLGRNAPNVRDLSITTSIATDDSICHCLAAMSAKMRRLSFYDSEVTDQLICKLVDLVPSLEELDVRTCTSVSTQSVARFVEMLRETHGTRLKKVQIDPPDVYSTWWDGIAYTWLDFIGILERDELDFEGDGPSPRDEKVRKRWIVEGKGSWERETRLEWEATREAEKAQQERDALAQIAALQQHIAAGGSGSGSGSGGGGSGSMSRLNVVPPGQWYQSAQHHLPRLGHFAPIQHPTLPPSSPGAVARVIPSQAASAQEQPHSDSVDPRLAARNATSGMDTN